MEFFDDPSELEDHIIPLIRYHIDYGEWDLVENDIDQHIDIIKTQLLKMHNAFVKNKSLKKHKKEIHPYYHLLSECKEIDDLLDVKRFEIFHGSGLFSEYLSGSEEFRKCLLALYSMKATLGWEKSFDDEEQVKQDLQRDVDRLHQNLKDAMLIIISSEKWGVEREVEKNERGRKKGQDAPKHLVSLYVCIVEIINGKGGMRLDSRKYSWIFKKIKTYTSDNLYRYKNFSLEYEPDDKRLYQTEYDPDDDKKIIKERNVSIDSVYGYIARMKEDHLRRMKRKK